MLLFFVVVVFVFVLSAPPFTTHTDLRSAPSPKSLVNPPGYLSACPCTHRLPQTRSLGLHPDPFNPQGTLISARPLTHSHRPKVRVSTRIPSTSMVPFCRPLTYSHRPKVRVSTRISSTQRVPFLRLSTAEPNYAVLDRRKRYIFKTRKQRANKKQDTTRAQVLLSIVSI